MFHTASICVRRSSATILALALFGILLAGCSAPFTKAPGSTGSTGAAASSLQLNTSGVATVKQVQLRATIVCGPWIVLAPHASTYSQGELAAIKQFVAQFSATIVGPDASNGYTAATVAALPPTLRFIPGDVFCSGTYEVTNTGSSLIQVNGAGFQPTQAPSPFSYDYHLLDACPYLQICNCGGCGASYPCAYALDLPMDLSSSQVMQTFPPNQDPSCPSPINLQPGATIPISMTFDKPKSGGGTWFRGVPALDITTPQGTTTLTYPTLLDSLVFVNLTEHQSTPAFVTAPDGQSYSGNNNSIPGICYTQKGDSFAPITSYTSTLDVSKPDWPVYSPVCV